MICGKAQRHLTGLLGLGLSVMMTLPVLAQTAAPGAGSYVLNAAHSKMHFSISHFVVSTTEGQFTNFDGKLVFSRSAPEHGTVTIHVSPGSVDTGIAARDEHLRSADFFDVSKFPLATFESTGLSMTGSKAGKLTGMLTLHGVTKPVTLNATLQSPDLTGDQLAFSAKGVLKRSDFGMTSYAGVIGDEVTLDFDVEFDRAR
jgi:polyisoprenoid-binding protein YceI